LEIFEEAASSPGAREGEIVMSRDVYLVQNPWRLSCLGAGEGRGSGVQLLHEERKIG
jgi:hypothetical protein